MSVRSQSAFLRKAGTLTVWLIIFCIYFLGVYNYVQIRNDTAVSVFLSAAYPDRKGAENILKQERTAGSSSNAASPAFFGKVEDTTVP